MTPNTEPDRAGTTVLCLACGEHVRIVTHPGETRWRYAEHAAGRSGERCGNSDRLVDEGGRN